MQNSGQEGARGRDPAARRAGALLILTAIATAAAVGLRVVADTDQPTLVESLAAIADNRGVYGLGSLVRLASGVVLMAAAWQLSRTWIIREGFGASLVPALFSASGAFTAISGVCAIALTFTAADAPVQGEMSGFTEFVAFARGLSGKIGFALAGLALIVAGRQQWKAGAPLRYISPASVVVGIAMLFIWLDAATAVHRVSGVLFLVWLAGIGLMLTAGRVERHFSRVAEATSGE